MAYTPATLSLATWTSPLTIQATDLLTGLDDAVNAIVDTNAGSIKNHINTEMAKVPTYLSAELVKINTDVLATSAGNVTSASNYATAASNSATSAAASAALAATFDPNNYYPKASTYTKTEVDTALGLKQNTLVSGTNIKTVGGQSLLGTGDVPTLPAQTGNSGKFLTTNGTDASWGSVPAGMALLATINAANSATIDIDVSAFTQYDNFIVLCDNIESSVDNQALKCIFRIDGSYSTGSYYGSNSYVVPSTGTWQVAVDNGVTDLTLLSRLYPLTTLNYRGSAKIEFTASHVANNRYHRVNCSANTGNGQVWTSGGSKNGGTTTFTGIRLYTTTGNILAGIFKIYGIAK